MTNRHRQSYARNRKRIEKDWTAGLGSLNVLTRINGSHWRTPPVQEQYENNADSAIGDWRLIVQQPDEGLVVLPRAP